MQIKVLHQKLLLMILLLLVSAFSMQAVYASNFEVANVAIKGYDPVSYFEDAQAMRGLSDHTVLYEGSTYMFSTDEHKDMFIANPEKYLPQFGGYCAMGAAMGKKLYIDPAAFTLRNGKLYLNLNKEIRKVWKRDITDNIEKANINWVQIKDKAPDQL